MAHSDPYALPFTLPAGTALVGPTTWAGQVDADPSTLLVCESLPRLMAAARTDIGAGGAAPVCVSGGESETGSARLLLLHADHLQAAHASASLAEQIAQLIDRMPHLLPVLIYTDLSLDACSELFSAGLFAALPAPVTEQRWHSLLERLQRTADSRERRLMWQESARLGQRLRDHQQQLRQQVAQLAGELTQTQESLQQTNQELTAHMAQLALLYRFGRELSSARNWDATLRSILQNLSQFVGASGAALILRSTPQGRYSPRQTFQWDEPIWDRVIVRLEDQLRQDVAERILAPGVFRLDTEPKSGSDPAGKVLTLPLEQQGRRLGYLLLLDRRGKRTQKVRGFLPFLQAVQVILAEEVAGAQLMDRMREIGSFNARVLETVRSGIWVLDELGRTIYCNRTGHELLGGRSATGAAVADPAAVVGRGRSRFGDGGKEPGPVPYDMLRDTDQPELFLDGLLRLDHIEGVPLARLLERGETPFRGEGRIVREDGTVTPVLVQTSLMAGRGRDESWLVVVVEDLSEARKLEAERMRADSLESLVEMSTALAHEIRNPLMGLSAQAELLADQLPDGDRRKRYLDVITSEVERINDTINRLLHFVRPYEARLAPVVLPDLARDCLELARPKAAEKGVRLALRCDPAGEASASWRRTLDGGQIKQVLLNLLLNAVEASPADAEVSVRLRCCDRMELADARRGTGQMTAGTMLEVRDYGSGFPDADAERIFRPFFTTKATGTGLGLSICRKIVSAHGGEIRAERDQNQTVFRVLLPEEQPLGVQQRQETS